MSSHVLFVAQQRIAVGKNQHGENNPEKVGALPPYHDLHAVSYQPNGAHIVLEKFSVRRNESLCQMAVRFGWHGGAPS